jgi:DNA-binding NarL/FixJ family response regulator
MMEGWWRLFRQDAFLAATFTLEHLPAGWDVAGQREQLAGGQDELAAAYREGRAVPVGEVADVALRLLDEVATATSGAETAPRTAHRSMEHNPLSEREYDVLRLVAEGLTNKAIARRLIVSENTVKGYATSLFNKLGVDSRAQAVAVAAQRGLLDEPTESR